MNQQLLRRTRMWRKNPDTKEISASCSYDVLKSSKEKEKMDSIAS